MSYSSRGASSSSIRASGVLFAILLCASGCVTGRWAPGNGRLAAEREVLVASEIGSLYGNALDAIEHLRPEYLTAGATSSDSASPREPVVYLNGNRLAGLDGLRGVPVSWIVEIRYVRGSMAGVRYGGDHAAGAVLVTTSRNR